MKTSELQNYSFELSGLADMMMHQLTVIPNIKKTPNYKMKRFQISEIIKAATAINNARMCVISDFEPGLPGVSEVENELNNLTEGYNTEMDKLRAENKRLKAGK